MIFKNRIYLLVLMLLASVSGYSQDFGIKTNLLSDLTLNANLGVEVGVAPHWTVGLTGQYNGWTVNAHKWKHWLIEPEARYWLCRRFGGHFFGAHLLGGQYNFGNIKNGISFLGSDFSRLTDNRFQGWGVGGGLSYGYAWVLGRHWNIEAEIGIGYIYTRYDEFECRDCGRRMAEDQPHHYVGPTKAAVNLVYVF